MVFIRVFLLTCCEVACDRRPAGQTPVWLKARKFFALPFPLSAANDAFSSGAGDRMPVCVTAEEARNLAPVIGRRQCVWVTRSLTGVVVCSVGAVVISDRLKEAI